MHLLLVVRHLLLVASILCQDMRQSIRFQVDEEDDKMPKVSKSPMSLDLSKRQPDSTVSRYHCKYSHGYSAYTRNAHVVNRLLIQCRWLLHALAHVCQRFQSASNNKLRQQKPEVPDIGKTWLIRPSGAWGKSQWPPTY